MKNIIATLFVLLFWTSINAQNLEKAEFQDVCGDPSVESMAWAVVYGKVIEIIDGNSIIIKQETGKNKTIDLVAIDSTLNEVKAKEFLVENLLRKKIQVLINPSNLRDKKVSSVVRFNDKVINRLMIEQGISGFKKPVPYSLSNYSICVYQKVEEKAKQDKLGIWAK